MKIYTMIAESSSGRVIKEMDIEATSESDAKAHLWNAMTDDEQDVSASIECVEVKG